MFLSLTQNGLFIFQFNILNQINVSIQIQFSLQKQNSIQNQYIFQYQVQQFISQQFISIIFIVQKQQSMNLFDEKVLNVKTDANCHIKFLNFLKKMTKIFRIKCTIQTNEKLIILKKTIIQTNQKSKINVISKSLRKQLRIFRKKLLNIKFHKFIMRTANFRDMFFKY